MALTYVDALFHGRSARHALWEGGVVLTLGLAALALVGAIRPSRWLLILAGMVGVLLALALLASALLPGVAIESR
ncbi:hypothetical protein DDZ18_02035 [Marinicauda salina]|uniref:Uncharacterized protein n=1 Tax=Marinicauda salina TaxID=2135793 RepID=A0A2U2BWL1_9PROT|nr:hypothetical protein DDZ18_02035 [Marinicauda salina]